MEQSIVLSSPQGNLSHLTLANTQLIKVLHFVLPVGNVASSFLNAVRNIPGIQLELIENWAMLSASEIAKLIQNTDVLILSRTPIIPDEIANNPGRLKYICYLHGTMRKAINLSVVRSGIKITNWGNSSGRGLAECSMTLLLAVFKDLPRRIMAVRNGAGKGIRSMGGHLSELNIGIYGYGFAGREFAKLIRPFGSTIRVFDPYATEIAEDCIRVNSLKELFATSQAISIHAGLTEETEKSVTRELLALLPDQGIVINTARGAIIDQEALFDELRSGRLRAGVDVLWPDNLPENHEARQWENLIWTCHQFLGKAWANEAEEVGLNHYQVHLENLKSFVAGKPLQFLIDEVRYTRMT